MSINFTGIPWIGEPLEPNDGSVPPGFGGFERDNQQTQEIDSQELKLMDSFLDSVAMDNGMPEAPQAQLPEPFNFTEWRTDLEALHLSMQAMDQDLPQWRFSNEPPLQPAHTFTQWGGRYPEELYVSIQDDYEYPTTFRQDDFLLAVSDAHRHWLHHSQVPPIDPVELKEYSLRILELNAIQLDRAIGNQTESYYPPEQIFPPSSRSTPPQRESFADIMRRDEGLPGNPACTSCQGKSILCPVHRHDIPILKR